MEGTYNLIWCSYFETSLASANYYFGSLINISFLTRVFRTTYTITLKNNTLHVGYREAVRNSKGANVLLDNHLELFND